VEGLLNPTRCDTDNTVLNRVVLVFTNTFFAYGVTAFS
jgi:hypothetical protein